MNVPPPVVERHNIQGPCLQGLHASCVSATATQIKKTTATGPFSRFRPAFALYNKPRREEVIFVPAPQASHVQSPRRACASSAGRLVSSRERSPHSTLHLHNTIHSHPHHCTHPHHRTLVSFTRTILRLLINPRTHAKSISAICTTNVSLRSRSQSPWRCARPQDALHAASLSFVGCHQCTCLAICILGKNYHLVFRVGVAPIPRTRCARIGHVSRSVPAKRPSRFATRRHH